MNRKIYLIIILLISIFSGAYAQVDLNRGLVAYYPFNGNANDASGNGLNGLERNGIQLTTDKYGNPNSAYLFDGIDDYIEILDDPRLRFRDSFSVCISYMKLSAPGGNLIEKRSYSSGTNSSFDIAAGSAGANGAVKTWGDCSDAGFGWNYTSFTQPPALNQWYCIVMTFNNGTLNFYQDAVLISSTTTLIPAVDSCAGSTIRIGRHLSFDPIAMHGKIDEVRLYNRAINQAEISSLCNETSNTPVQCNNWLKITNDFDYAAIGDLDITGNQITVEALFDADTNYFLPSTVAFDLVSKHTTPANCNYLLRPVTAEITTTNGFFQIVACDYIAKKINHAALVYDGSSLKFYRNGFLMGSMPASGNLITNDLVTKIGNYAALTRSEALKGYINEVRIWNVARTQQQINDNMYSTLPNPSAQTGLLAYYTFDDLLNKNGSGLYNASLLGTASINNTNPTCNFIADSCLNVVPVKITGFSASTPVNRYIQLNWTTGEETGILNYVIERATAAGGPFIEIGSVVAKNTNTGSDYLFVDNTAKPNINYFYRLRIIETTGRKSYSAVRTAMIKGNGLFINIYPNPAADIITVQIANAATSANINLYNSIGQLLTQKKTTSTSNDAVNIDIKNLPKGNYLVQVIAGDESIIKKIEKL